MQQKYTKALDGWNGPFSLFFFPIEKQYRVITISLFMVMYTVYGIGHILFRLFLARFGKIV
jgi:hypothetical protein